MSAFHSTHGRPPRNSGNEKTETGFIRLVLRRLIDSGTPTTAKKYDQIRRVHFCGRLHREEKDADCADSEREQQKVFQIELRHETAALHQNSEARVSSDDEPCLVNSRQSFVFLCYRREGAMSRLR
jgi:hypothetical protein